MPEENLEELHYVDAKRLDDYLAQLRIRTEEEVKSKAMEAEFSATGPSVKFTQESTFKPVDVHTKIKRLELALQEKHRLIYCRPVKDWTEVEYVKEKFAAHRVAVPTITNSEQRTPAFTFWLSPGDEETGMLCLLEDCRSDDSPTFSYARCSTYTVLQSLVYFARAQVNASVLSRHISQNDNPNQYGKVDESHPPSLFHEFHNVKEWLYEFVTKPVPLLTKWGAFVSPPRKVQSLYRIREYGREAAHGWTKTTTFGYPICIYDSK